jgi:hypothetical protein
MTFMVAPQPEQRNARSVLAAERGKDPRLLP